MKDQNQANLKWWQKSIVYQIYPRSFADSNGDGIGDIKGIISKLDYLKDLGINVIWLSPVYASPNEDNGYDISDYYSIHPDFGTMDDFDELIKQAKARGIKIVMDLVINHTSSEHEWFKKSCEGIEPYKDYYFWSDTWENTPNNWTGFFGEKCWEYDETRCAYYMHLFAKHQPDLNYHNPLVLEEVKKILTFWLEKGIAGFRCDVINIIYKDNLNNGKKKLILTGSEHYLTLDGTHEILKELGEIIEKYDAFTVGETVFVDTKTASLLTNPGRKELNMVFGFEHMEVDQIIVKWFKKSFNWQKFIKVIDKWERDVFWNTIYLENHDQPRSVSRFGSNKYPVESAKLLATFLLTAKGTPFIFEGEEIGMTNFDYNSMEDIKDVESKNIYNLLTSLHFPKKLRWKMIKRTSRDNARTPMQWNSLENAGFSTGSPWLKVNDNYNEINVSASEQNAFSVLNCYRNLISFRSKSEDLLAGDYKLLLNNKHIAAYKRGNLIIILNHSDKKCKTDFKGNLIFSTYDRKDFDGSFDPWEAVIIK